mmetsp:Transcript_18379/g.52524  ORF Transcript_18379/g.52524 Transcript_18379/m.52524 type:complete len:226 (+) Transcript_18379:140-817(+)
MIISDFVSNVNFSETLLAVLPVQQDVVLLVGFRVEDRKCRFDCRADTVLPFAGSVACAHARQRVAAVSLENCDSGVVGCQRAASRDDRSSTGSEHGVEPSGCTRCKSTACLYEYNSPVDSVGDFIQVCLQNIFRVLAYFIVPVFATETPVRQDIVAAFQETAMDQNAIGHAAFGIPRHSTLLKASIIIVVSRDALEVVTFATQHGDLCVIERKVDVLILQQSLLI